MVWDLITSAVSTVVSTVSSAFSTVASTLGGVFSTITNTIGPVISTVLEKGGAFIGKIIEGANGLLQGLGILKPDERIDEMGERALQAAQQGIVLERFDDFDQYLDELRNFPLDPEVAKNRPTLERQTAAIVLSTGALAHKFNLTDRDSAAVLTLLGTSSGYFTPERVRDWIVTGRLACDVFDYLDRRLSGEEALRVEQGLAAGLSEDEKRQLYAALDEARDLFQSKDDNPGASR